MAILEQVGCHAQATLSPNLEGSRIPHSYLFASSVANETEILGEKLGLAFSRGCSTLLGTPRSCSIILGLPNFLNSPKNSVRAILGLSRHFSVILGVSRWCSAGLVLVSAPRLQHCLLVSDVYFQGIIKADSTRANSEKFEPGPSYR
jgi:hypothetical protein